MSALSEADRAPLASPYVEGEPFIYQERVSITFNEKPMGIDLETKPFFGGLRKGVAVKGFSPSSKAVDRICIGDVLVNVNGVPCEGCSFDDTMKMLRTAAYPVTLQLEMKSSGNYNMGASSSSRTGGAEVTMELLEVPLEYQKPAQDATAPSLAPEDSAATI
jgi:hypothetical protein